MSTILVGFTGAVIAAIVFLLAVLRLGHQGQPRFGKLARDRSDRLQRLAGVFQLFPDLLCTLDKGVNKLAAGIRLVSRFRQIPAAAETFSRNEP